MLEGKANKSPLSSDVIGCFKDSTAHNVKEQLCCVDPGRFSLSHRKETADVLCTNQPLAYVCYLDEGKMLHDILLYLSLQTHAMSKELFHLQ